jgi:hypothetical protein
MQARRDFLLIGFAWLLLCGQTIAHESRPALFEIRELEATPAAEKVYRYQVLWEIPRSVPGSTLPRLLLPSGCAAQYHVGENLLDYSGKQLYHCDEPLTGTTLQLDFPLINPSLSTLLRVNFADDQQFSHLLVPGKNLWTIPAMERSQGVVRAFTWLGVQHIWRGIDHLLFVACLVFIASTTRKIILTITGFTVGHSITLLAATLGWVSLPVAPIEAVIALSIAFLAHEIAVDDQASWTRRHPVAISSSFGLLHGFGFAAVLGEIGLPQAELGTALLFFNVGIEIGQLLFLALPVTLIALSGKYLAASASSHPPYFRGIASYSIGGIAAYWVITRVATFWA